MLEAREEIEHEILWELNSGNTSVWHENWIGIGPLYHVLPQDFNKNDEIQDVAELRDGNTWDDLTLDQNFPEDISDHMRHNVPFDQTIGKWDTSQWMPTISGKLWKKKIPTDNLWRRNGYIIVSKYWCCSPPNEDSYLHLFLKSDTVDRVWKTFLQPAGIIINMVQVHQVIKVWWNEPCCPKLKPLFQAAPFIITWELWKRRNKMKHGEVVSKKRLAEELPGICPMQAGFKCNSDGSSKGNPGPSSYGYCIRDSAGD
nr:uncharacterized protein LOC117275203 [Nicotiana tomentosiformis]